MDIMLHTDVNRIQTAVEELGTNGKPRKFTKLLNFDGAGRLMLLSHPG